MFRSRLFFASFFIALIQNSFAGDKVKSIKTILDLEKYLISNRISSVQEYTASLLKNQINPQIVFIKNSRSLQSSTEFNPRVLIGLGENENAYEFSVTIGSTLDPSGRGENLEGMMVDTTRPEKPIRFFTVDFPSSTSFNDKNFQIHQDDDVQTLCQACHRKGFIWNSVRFWPGASRELSHGSESLLKAHQYLENLARSIEGDHSPYRSARERYIPLIELYEKNSQTSDPEGLLGRFSSSHALNRLSIAIESENPESYHRYRFAIVGALLNCELQSFQTPQSAHYHEAVQALKIRFQEKMKVQLDEELARSYYFNQWTAESILKSDLREHFLPKDQSALDRVVKLQWVLSQFSMIDLRSFSIDFLHANFEFWNDDDDLGSLAKKLNPLLKTQKLDCESLRIASQEVFQ